jgi:hypothetical protein
MNNLELVFEGIPISPFAERQDLHFWRDYIHGIAEQNWIEDKKLPQGAINIKIYYFYEAAPAATGDITKPILDALIGLAFTNYKQIKDQDFEKFDINGSYRIHHLTPFLAEALSRISGDFFYVEIQDLAFSEYQNDEGVVDQSSEELPKGPRTISHRTSPIQVDETGNTETVQSDIPRSNDLPPFLKGKHDTGLPPGGEKILDNNLSDSAIHSEDHWWDDLPLQPESFALPSPDSLRETEASEYQPEFDEENDLLPPVSEITEPQSKEVAEEQESVEKGTHADTEESNDSEEI